MAKRYCIVLSVLMAGLLFALPVSAQEDYAGSVDMTVACLGGNVAELTLSHYVPEDIPTRYVGWIVVRRVVGKCVDDVQVGPVRDFPAAGPSEVVIIDQLAEDGYNVVYFVYAVTDSGGTEFLPWPRRAMFQWADCAGGPAARGVMEVWGTEPYVNPHLLVCPDECWYGLSYLDGSYPAEWLDLEGVTVEVFGELKLGMEGIYIDIASWRLSPTACLGVPVEHPTWDKLKAYYR